MSNSSKPFQHTIELAGLPAPRIRFIDATRGFAMLLVMLTHFVQVFVLTDGWVRTVVSNAGLVATPTFIIISGMMVGFLYRARPSSFDSFRTKLFDRGLFLLTLGHLLVLGSHLAMSPTSHRMFVTDAVGVCVLIGPWLLVRSSARFRLTLSLALYSGSWLALIFWQPSTVFGLATKEALFGSFASLRFFEYVFPIIPWFSVDLVSTVIGEWLGRLHVEGSFAEMRRYLVRAAVGAVGIALALAVPAKFVLAPRITGHPVFERLVMMLRLVNQKDPPGPIFLLMHGAVGLAFLIACLNAEQRRVVPRAMSFVSVIGQNSFFAFVIQYYVYYVGLYLLRPYLPMDWAGPLYFALSLALVLWIVFTWHRSGLNCYITVGYPALSKFVREETRDLSDVRTVGPLGFATPRRKNVS